MKFDTAKIENLPVRTVKWKGALGFRGFFMPSSVLQASLFEQGKNCLQDEFQRLLARHGRPVPPIIILDLMNGDEGQYTFW